MAAATYLPENISATINHGMGPNLSHSMLEAIHNTLPSRPANLYVPKFKEDHIDIHGHKRNHISQDTLQTQNDKDATEEHHARRPENQSPAPTPIHQEKHGIHRQNIHSAHDCGANQWVIEPITSKNVRFFISAVKKVRAPNRRKPHLHPFEKRRRVIEHGVDSRELL